MQQYKNNNNEGLSICIPTYNRVISLQETLESALSLKELKRVNYEIIISDDSVNDETKKYIKDLKNNKIRYFKNNVRGQFNSLNNLIDKSRYAWILFLHDDDLLASNYLQKVLPYTEKNLNVEVIWTGREFIRDDGSKLQDHIAGKSGFGDVITIDHNDLEKNVLSGGYTGKNKYVGMMVTGLLAQKTLIKKAGGFDPLLSVNADGLFLNKLQFLASKAAYVNLPLVKYRITDGSERGKPSQEGVIYQEVVKIMDKTLDFLRHHLSREKYIYKKYIYEKNFYRNVLIINGPLLWIALRYKGNYLNRLNIQFRILKDVFNSFPLFFLKPLTIIVIILSFFPQFILNKLYKEYLKFI